jgi:transposase-like protein
MEARTKYSQEFKDAVVTRIMNRGGRTIEAVCEEAGVRKQTAANWLQRRGKVGANASPGGRMKWTGEAKLKAVVDTSGLSEHEVGAYVRREGLYSNQVSEWRAEVIEYLGMKPSFKKDERDEKIKVLEREILRKDKALAEASALLILQKKVDLIWGSKDAGEK